jgi:phosphoglycolate phosphatase-like HAD superfamily hydrolase
MHLKISTVSDLPLHRYRTLVFDSDGVVLDSNAVKTGAFYRTVLPWGEGPARALVDYHVSRGGISRYVKFKYFLEEIVHQPVTEAVMQHLLHTFTEEAMRGLVEAELAPGLEALRKATPHARWMVVTGGDQGELREVYARKNIAQWFDAGLFGSPDSKDEILVREIATGNLQLPAIFFGDSRYDHQAATRAGLDFIFVSGWTEFAEWASYCAEHGITVVERLAA